MTTKVAINGLGRIGRAILKMVIDEPTMELVAVNDLVDVENLAYLLRFDTVYGRYSKPVVVDGGDLVVAGRKLRTLSNRDPSDLPWRELGVELVFECTGALTRREDLREAHRRGRAICSPVGAVERRRGGNGYPWCERAGRHSRHHLLRKLHDELHHADRRGHWPPHRVSRRRP